MAVLDQAHLQLKMVYKEKKAVEEKLEISDVNNRYNKVGIYVLFTFVHTFVYKNKPVYQTTCVIQDGMNPIISIHVQCSYNM